jgi:mRNA interferase YafQ
MPELYYSKRFDKSFKRLVKSGNFDDLKLEKVLALLEAGMELESKHRNHRLTGSMAQYHECHIENDLLLIYEISQSGKFIEVIDIGSHSELFD